MSYDIGMSAINLEPTERVGHTEYCSNAALRRAVCGDGPVRFEDAWDFDFTWTVNDGLNWGEKGRVTDMGHAEFLENGVDKRQPIPSPFATPEDVLEFDAVEEYGLRDEAELVAYYQNWHDEAQRGNPNQVVPGGYYKTIVSGAIQAFGWDMLLLAAAEKERFANTLESFFRLSLHHYKAWAQTSIDVFLCHDDMVWTEGPFIHPDFYRSVIFPRYKQLWSVLEEAGKKVLFCSDGDFTMFIDDIADAGADGFIFEPMTSLEVATERYGKTHLIMASKVDCRTLTFGGREAIAAEIDATMALARQCAGFIFAVGNHIPSNVPVDNGLFYMDYLRQNWHR